MAPALRLLRARNPSRSRIGSALLVADPVFESSDERMPRGAARSQVLPLNLQFPRLQATGTEIARIEQHLAGARIQRLTGFDASRDALLASLQTPVDLLHLATHSRVDPDFPQLSAIVLSRYDQAGRERVPWVYAADLRSLPLTGSYVVMSACEGALGKRVEGEGLIGLSYALLGAGTRGVVAATWRVADAATASYMDAFYESLREQADLPRAAAHAARRMLKDRQWSHPNHWAAFAALESEM
jgi:CHAT domain-containing protein